MTENPQIALDENGFFLVGQFDGKGVRRPIADYMMRLVARPLVRADGASCLTDEEIESLVAWADKLGGVFHHELRKELRRRHSWTPATVYPWADDEIVIIDEAPGGRSVYSKSENGYDCYGAHFDTADELAGYARRVGATIRRAAFVKDGE